MCQGPGSSAAGFGAGHPLLRPQALPQPANLRHTPADIASHANACCKRDCSRASALSRQGLLAGTEYGYCSAAGAAGAAAAAPSPTPDIAQSLDTAVVARRTTIDGAKCRLPVMFRCAQLRCLT